MEDKTDWSVVPSASQFKLTARQEEARALLRSHRHTLLVGGSRSGKTTLLVHAIAERALRFRNSRHAILRLHANAARASIALDTLPKVFRLGFPGRRLKRHRTEGYFSLENGSEIWIGGLGDQDQVLALERRAEEDREIRDRSHAENRAAIAALTQKLDQHAATVEVMRPAVAALEISRAKLAGWASIGFAVVVVCGWMVEATVKWALTWIWSHVH